MADQLICKSSHMRKNIDNILREKYPALAAIGWEVSSAEVERDAQALFGGSFEAILKRGL